MAFVQLFKACSQDNTVLGIMADVLTKLKIGMPNLDSVFYRQDNAGCSSLRDSTTVVAEVLADKAGVSLKRLDFSDPQGEKGACDRKGATVKSHKQIFLNAGDIETAAQMREAIEFSGGVHGVNVTLSEIPERQTKNAVSCEGVSFVNNIGYESDFLRLWKAYNIGPGKNSPLEQI